MYKIKSDIFYPLTARRLRPLRDATEKVVSLVSQGVKYMPKCSLIIKYC